MTTRPGRAVQDHYPEGFAHCFGCGRLNTHGHHIRSFPEGEDVVARFTPEPYHIALPGFVYGGLVASLIDCHGIGTAAADALRRQGRDVGAVETPRYVTAALHVNFLRPTPMGVELEVRGRIREASDRKAIVEVTVLAADTVTATGEVVAVRAPESMGGR